MRPKYRVIKVEGSNCPVEIGEILYLGNVDYGLAADDSRATGIPHISLCKNPTGYPTFTIPTRNIERIIE